jgi:hypothetical protein
MSDTSKTRQPKTLSELQAVREKEVEARSASKQAILEENSVKQSAETDQSPDDSFSELSDSAQFELLDAGFGNNSDIDSMSSGAGVDWGFGVFLVAIAGLLWLMKRL